MSDDLQPGPYRGETHAGPPETRESILWLALSPTVWALHLVAAYATVAVWCAKSHAEGLPFVPVGVALSIYTAVALGVIGVALVRGWRAHRLGTAWVPHAMDSPGDRHRFLGLSIVLLSGLSAIAVLYVGAALVLVDTCR